MRWNPPSTAAALALVLIGYSSFSLSDATVKALGASFKGVEITGASSTVVTLLCLMVLLLKKSTVRGAKENWHIHLARSIMLVVSTVINFSCLARVPFTRFYTIMFTTPLFVTILAVLFFRERPSKSSLVAVGLGFAGVVIGNMSSNAQSNIWYDLALLLSASLFAVSIVLTRLCSTATHPLFFALYPKALSALVLLPSTIAFCSQLTHSYQGVLVLAGGSLDTLAYITLGIGFQSGCASRLAPCQYIQMLWGLALGRIIWQELPGFSGMLGSIMVVACGYLVIRQKGRKQSAVVS